MNYKKWLRLFLISNIFLFFTIILTTVYFHNNGVPLRMTNSISYDAKLNFLRKTKLLESSDTIVIGSSMALNNIDSLTLQQNNKDIKKVANVASWGLQTSESLELLKILNLKKVKRIIFSTQFNDFILVRYKDVEKNNVEKFLYSDNLKDTILLPYFNTVNSIIPNFFEYLNWKSTYRNKNSNKYLAFDENGDVNLTFEKNKKEQNDWFVINPNRKLEEKNYENLISMKKIAEENNIEFIVVTTPFKKSAFINKKLHNIFISHNEKLKKLSEKHSFKYINTHNKLDLSDKYFLDKIHVNKKGAILISKEVAKQLKQ